MTTDVDRFSDYVRTHLSSTLDEYPGGWPSEIESALLDAILSIRARYGAPDSGVRGAVQKWRTHRLPDRPDDLQVLAKGSGPEISSILGNRQVLSGGSFKTDAAIQAASRLGAAGVQHAADLDPSSAEHRQAYVGVKGLGPVTWSYFCMLLGHQDVKADVWIVRVVEQALGAPATPEHARQVVVDSARELHVEPRVLDHALWDFARMGGLADEAEEG